MALGNPTGQLSRDEAVRILFGDQRINILYSLYPVNGVLFVLSMALQITVATLDGVKGTTMTLVSIPFVLVVLYFILTVLAFMAQRNNSPNLLVGSSVLTVMCCTWGIVSLFCFGTLVVISGISCTTENCAGICICAVLLCLITAAGLVVNLVGARLLSPLICCNPMLVPGSTAAVTAVSRTTEDISNDPTGGAAAAEEISFPPAPAGATEDDDWRGIAAVTSISNEAYNFDQSAIIAQTSDSSSTA